ncbi:hypothetical protein C2S52_010403 [Perilla frutescens var. hirtella]|nr:hypothetical protein C2S52_010403 [Perilla frutescens var. hirtella]
MATSCVDKSGSSSATIASGGIGRDCCLTGASGGRLVCLQGRVKSVLAFHSPPREGDYGVQIPTLGLPRNATLQEGTSSTSYDGDGYFRDASGLRGIVGGRLE